MKKVFTLVALCLAVSLSACTKKDAAQDGATGEQVEGTTTAPTEGAAENPTNEMEEKTDGQTAPAEESNAH
jgi:hypothetical protein